MTEQPAAPDIVEGLAAEVVSTIWRNAYHDEICAWYDAGESDEDYGTCDCATSTVATQVFDRITSALAERNREFARAEAAEAERDRYREALEYQWEMNHDEHCSRLVNGLCTSNSGCHWPKPAALVEAR